MVTTITDFVPTVTGRKIGLIGVGKMGVGIGTNLLRHGAFLQIKGRTNREGIDCLAKAGAKEHVSVLALGKESEAVILSLPSTKEVEQVCLGENGLFAALSPNNLVIDCTTSLPSSTVTLHEKASKACIRFVDAPVTRTPKEAELGRLVAILGSDEVEIPEVVGILAAFCETIIHVGSIGSGHKLKLLNNALTMSMTAAVAETCCLAMNLGINIATLRAIIGRGGANCGPFQGICSFLLGEDPQALAFSIENAAKDLRYLSEISKDVSILSPVIKSVTQKYEHAVDIGIGSKNLPHLVYAEISSNSK